MEFCMKKMGGFCAKKSPKNEPKKWGVFRVLNFSNLRNFFTQFSRWKNAKNFREKARFWMIMQEI